MADSLATLSISTSNENQASRIGVVVAGHLGVDAVVDAIVRALALEGIKGDTVVVSHISDPLILPYAALHMGQSGCAVVIASAVISGDAAHADVLAHTLVGSLLQSGTSNMTQIVPGIICQSSLLEVKVRAFFLTSRPCRPYIASRLRTTFSQCRRSCPIRLLHGQNLQLHCSASRAAPVFP